MMMAMAVGAKLVGAAGTVGGVAASAGTALKVAAGATTALQAYSQFGAARADARLMAQRAEDERLMGVEEGVAARNQVTEINRRFVEVAGAQRVAFAQNGFSIGSGSSRAARRQSLEETSRQTRSILDQDRVRQRQRSLRAQGFMKSARDRRKSALFGVGGLIGGNVIKALG